MIVEGDRVATRFTSRATHRGEFMGIPATGRRIEIGEVAIFRMRDGRIAEQWAYPDTATLQQQLTGAPRAEADNEQP